MLKSTSPEFRRQLSIARIAAAAADRSLDVLQTYCITGILTDGGVTLESTVYDAERYLHEAARAVQKIANG
jgi:hypothetical protein